MCVQLVDPSPALERNVTLPTLDENAIMQEYDDYIRKLAHQYIPRKIIHIDVLDLEIDELIQAVRVKFWEALSRNEIKSYKAYLRSMVHNEAISYTRKAKFHQFLDTDEEGEPYYGNLLLPQNEGTLDPLEILTEKETISEFIQQAVGAVMDFPPLQQKAILCVFKDRVDYMHELREALRAHHIDFKQLDWSGRKAALHSMKVSASLARKKLKALQKASLHA